MKKPALLIFALMGWVFFSAAVHAMPWTDLLLLLDDQDALPISIPAAPSGLSATAVSETEIQLRWSDNSNNEDGFRIYEKKGSCSGDFVALGTVSKGTTSELIVGLAPGTTACYKITAFNQAGESGYSNTNSATTYSNPATLRVINDLYNIDIGTNLWSKWNQIVYVRIGPYYPVVGAECNSVINNNNYERLNRVTTGSLPGPAIDPGYNSTPTIFTYEDFDVSSFTEGRYCVFLQAGWWELYVPSFGSPYWIINPTDAGTCSGEIAYDNKWNAYYILNHYSGTYELRASEMLPHGLWNGSSFCQ